MPIHDWSKVPAGRYHHFHQTWAVTICDDLNAGRLPEDYFALVEQHGIGMIPDVLTLKQPEQSRKPRGSGGVTGTLTPPRTRFVSTATEIEMFALRGNRIVVRSVGDRIVAVIEIVSPGNKDCRASLKKFVKKTLAFVERGVNVLVIDPFPPSSINPNGIHPLIWDEIKDEPFALPADKPLTLASYRAMPATAYVEPINIGDAIPDMPLFLEDDLYVQVGLEPTYIATWEKCPRHFKEDVLDAIRGQPHAED
jgi:hypothetical protein